MRAEHAEIGRHQIENVLWQRRAQACIVDQHLRRRILRQEQIGRRRGPLLQQLVAELGIAAIAQRDLDAGLLGEAVRPGLRQRFVLRVVDDEPVILRRGWPGQRRHRQQGGHQGNTECHFSPRGVSERLAE